MATLDQRLGALEAAHGRRCAMGRVVVLAPCGRLSEADQARADAARVAGVEVFTVEVWPRVARLLRRAARLEAGAAP